MSSRVSRKARPPAMPAGGEADSLLPRAWADFPPDVRAARDKAFRDLWARLPDGDRALLIDTWLDGWVAGHDDRQSLMDSLIGRPPKLSPDPFQPLIDAATKELQ